ncbi:hypothetical protein LQG66_34800 [Bradyrhizobium ontarionense]|uniref:DUF883 domain-containing protein n=1 Tax=Bradyrhizobium ontarionense TaxID=2898149 RepID=A0ABY3RA93_9BRAD|nr:hypothetical protein [Bradyrhizobium sp. A19]UFZ04299.1 hypothetical protein LQG66_34800 [Bradyrhizobium sp. A19]
MAIDSTTLNHELDRVTRELGRLLRMAGEAGQSSSHAQPAAVSLYTTIEALGAALTEADFHPKQLVRAHPIMATASAFALGIVVGLLFRRT